MSLTLRWAGYGTLLAAAVAACRATTGRPTFTPFPEAEHTEIGFDLAGEDETIFMVTDTVAARLRADSVPLARVRRFDGFIESRWFDAKTKKPLAGRPLGPDAVRVRAWVDPGKPGYSKVEVETVYVPKVDPSLPDREQEAPVATEHPVNRRMGEVLKALAATYGVPEADTAKAAARPDSARARPDSARITPGRDTTTRRPGTPTPVRRPVRPSPPPAPSPTPPPAPPPPPPPAPISRPA